MRVMCLDYGKKRTGIAVSDPLRIIATSIGTIPTPTLVDFLKDYFLKESVTQVLIGYPLNLDDSPTHATPLVNGFVNVFKNKFPKIPIEKIDERYSSKFASQAISGMGLKKKDREKKGLIDEVAAVMLLQEWLNRGV